MNDALTIRMAVAEDAPALLDIYRPYVEHTAITFEYDVPSTKEFASRILRTLQRYPFLIALCGGIAVGYAYASPFKERAAYDWAVETSIYIRKDYSGRGYGKALYDILERLLKAQNILNLNACIAYTAHTDEYLDNHSADFHAHLGYHPVGTFHECGYKFGRWYDIVWMEKMIGAHTVAPEPVRPIDQIDWSSLL